MSGSLIPNAKQQFLDANGNPLAGGFVYYYIPSTTTFKNTYQNAALTILNSNPIILDSAGECIAYGVGSFRQIVTDVNGNLIWDQPTLSLLTNDASTVIYTQGSTGSVSRTVTNKLQESVSIKDFGAVGDNSTDDTAAIQAALNSIPSTGGSLYINPGTYKISSSLTLLGKSNVNIYGSQMGESVINASLVNGSLFTLGYATGVTPPSPATLNNVTLQNFTLYGSGTSITKKIVEYRGINNVVFDGMEFYNGYEEGVYCDGANPAFNGLLVQNCYFHDCYKSNISNGVNVNSIGVSNIIITNNRFERMATGVYILGKNVVISNNTLYDINNVGIGVGESNFSASSSISSCVISNNTFYRLGKLTSGGYLAAVSRGIKTNGSIKNYADSTQDSGIVVANNTFKGTWIETSGSVVCLNLGGSVKAIGNYASNILNAGSTYSTFIQVDFSSDSGSYVGVNGSPVKTYLEDNTLDPSPYGNNFTYGLSVTSVNNSSLFCSGNKIYANPSTGLGGYFNAPTNGFLPFVSFNGDCISPSNTLYNLAGFEAGLGTNPLPIYGTNSTTFSTSASRDLFVDRATKDLTGLTTPNISNGNYFTTTNTVATTITNFTSSLGLTKGQEITIFFGDAFTTIQNGTNIYLNGGVNFTPIRFSSLTLVYGALPGVNAWIEKSRSFY
jgi:hypothetical protein